MSGATPNAQPGGPAVPGDNQAPQSGLDPVVEPGHDPESSPPGSPDPEPQEPGNEDRTWQSRHDKLHAQVEGIPEFLSELNLTPNQAIKALGQLDKLLGHEVLGEHVQDFFAGRTVSLRGGERVTDPDDDHAIDKPWEADLNALREENVGLRQQLGTVAQKQGVENVVAHTSKFLGDYPMNDEQLAEFEKRMDRSIDRLQDSDIQRMNYDQFRGIALIHIDDFRGEIEARKAQNKRGRLSDMATDAAPGQTTDGLEPSALTRAPTSKQDLKGLVKARVRQRIREGA